MLDTDRKRYMEKGRNYKKEEKIADRESVVSWKWRIGFRYLFSSLSH